MNRQHLLIVNPGSQRRLLARGIVAAARGRFALDFDNQNPGFFECCSFTTGRDRAILPRQAANDFMRHYHREVQFVHALKEAVRAQC